MVNTNYKYNYITIIYFWIKNKDVIQTAKSKKKIPLSLNNEPQLKKGIFAFSLFKKCKNTFDYYKYTSCDCSLLMK